MTLDDRYAVWGESQGGQAALWTGIEAARGYAPELRLVGVGAAAPATDLGPLLEAAQGTTPGKVLTAEAVSSWSQVHPDLDFDAAVARRARAPVRAIARRCLAPDFVVVAAQTVLLPERLLRIDLTTDPAWSRRVRENIPDGRIDAPVLVAQGTDDPLVSPAVRARWVARRCAAGQSIDFRRYPRVPVLPGCRTARSPLPAPADREPPGATDGGGAAMDPQRIDGDDTEGFGAAQPPGG